MTLNVTVSSETDARLRRLAREAGKDVATYVADLLEGSAAAERTAHATGSSAIDFDQALDALFAGDSRRLPAVPLDLSRDDIYVDHD